MTKREYLASIVKTLCNNSFMNGWFDDKSQEFQNEQINALMSMTDKELNSWIEQNKFNLEFYCEFTLQPIPKE